MMLFDTSQELAPISSAFFSGLRETALSPVPVNIFREQDRYVLEADLPGFDPSSIDITAEPGMLTIRADRDVSREDQGERWLIRERSSARVVRRIGLGRDIDLDAIAADYRDGVLELTLPVRADALPKKVAVTAGTPAEPAPRVIEAAESAQEAPDPKAEPAHSVGS